MRSQLAERHTVGQPACEERPGGVRQHHLPTVAAGGDTGSLVHVDADVVVAAELALTRVQTDPDPDGGSVVPRMRREPTLNGDGRSDRRRCRRERHEERVTFGADLDPAVLGDRGPHDGGVLVQHAQEPVASEVLQQSRRALDVGEQEGHRAGGQVVHPLNSTPAQRDVLSAQPAIAVASTNGYTGPLPASLSARATTASVHLESAISSTRSAGPFGTSPPARTLPRRCGPVGRCSPSRSAAGSPRPCGPPPGGTERLRQPSREVRHQIGMHHRRHARHPRG